MPDSGKKKKMSNRKFLKIWAPVLCIVLALTVAVNILTQVFRPYVDLYLGGGDMIVTKTAGSEDWDSDYYTLDYKDKRETAAAADVLVEEIESEGIVLLKNNGALPLSAPAKITLLGRSAADPIYGGSGSGSVDLSQGGRPAHRSGTRRVYRQRRRIRYSQAIRRLFRGNDRSGRFPGV